MSRFKYNVSDIEMIAFEGSPPYTSLKDIVESSWSPTSWINAPPRNGEGRWREIPIKDPLVQHAARAYLLPMSGGDAGDHRRSFVQKLRGRCCGIFGCLNGIVMLIVKKWKL